MKHLSENERSILTHISRFGSDGYPVQKMAGKWFVMEMYGVPGAPCAFKTKRAAVAQFEAYLASLRERAGNEAYERALAEQRGEQ